MVSELDPTADLPAGSFMARLRDWADLRGRIAADDEHGRWVSDKDREYADDEAQAMLADLADVLLDLSVGDHHAWYDIAANLTCTEANALRPLLALLHGEDVAQSFMESHAEGDEDCEDEHHEPCGPDCLKLVEH